MPCLQISEEMWTLNFLNVVVGFALLCLVFLIGGGAACKQGKSAFCNHFSSAVLQYAKCASPVQYPVTTGAPG